MDVGVSFGRFGSTAATKVEWATEAEQLGFESVWVGEGYGSDAITPLAYIAGRTHRIRLGTSVLQLAGRTPANAAMTVATLDRLSNGRLILGLGASTPAVVEGWHGSVAHPAVPWLREYVEIIRDVLLRNGPLAHEGTVYTIPSGGAASGIRMNVRPLREVVPIYLATNGAATVRLTAEIADGWMPVFFAPEAIDTVYASPLTDGRAARKLPGELGISPVVHVRTTTSVQSSLDDLRAETARYLSQGRAGPSNMSVRLATAYGFGSTVETVRSLLEAKAPRDAIAEVVPVELVDAINLVGSPTRIRARLNKFEDAGISRVIGIVPDRDTLHALAAVVG